MKPKFEFGDAVRVKFTSNVEGFDVAFEKTLFVVGYAIMLDSSDRVRTFRYTLNLSNPLNGMPMTPKEYYRNEEQLMPLEPIISEIHKANVDSQPQAEVPQS